MNSFVICQKYITLFLLKKLRVSRLSPYKKVISRNIFRSRDNSSCFLRKNLLNMDFLYIFWFIKVKGGHTNAHGVDLSPPLGKNPNYLSFLRLFSEAYLYAITIFDSVPNSSRVRGRRFKYMTLFPYKNLAYLVP